MSTFDVGTYTDDVATKWLTDAERRAWRNLALMQMQLNAALSRQLDGTDLSLQDYGVLAHLSDATNERDRMNDLGISLGWEKSRVSHHIARMERRGLVRRTKCPTDGRGWFVEMTDAGRAAIGAAAPGHVDAVRRHFIDLLTPTQIGQVDRIAGIVLAHLADSPTTP